MNQKTKRIVTTLVVLAIGWVALRGQHEWNEKGGVLRWTHHDPEGRHPGGWIESGGVRVE